MAKKRVLSGMQPSGLLHLGNLMGALDNWRKLQDEYECYYFIADWHALTSNYADTSKLRTLCPRDGHRLAGRRARPREMRHLPAVPRARPRRAARAPVHVHAPALARAGADLQGKDRADRGQGHAHLRVPGLSPAPGRGHPDLQGQFRARGHRPASAPGAHPRDLPQVQRLLRRGLPRAPAAHDRVSQASGHGRPEDEQELQQHDQPVRHARGDHEESDGNGDRPRPRPQAGPGQSRRLPAVLAGQDLRAQGMAATTWMSNAAARASGAWTTRRSC